MTLRYETRENFCGCHRETCTHWRYETYDTVTDSFVGYGYDMKSQADEQTKRRNDEDSKMQDSECIWTLDPESDFYHIRCNDDWWTDGAHPEGFKFCPQCGRKIVLALNGHPD